MEKIMNELTKKSCSIIQEAHSLVNGERKESYGDIEESFSRISGLWSAYLGMSIDSLDVAKMMILLKVSRAKNNNHRDSYVDIVGYVDCIDSILHKIKNG